MAQIKAERSLQAAPRSKHRLHYLWSFEAPLLWLLPAIFMLALFSFYPLFFNLFNSFREFNPVTKQFNVVGLANWEKLIQDARMWNALRITLTFTAVALLIEFFLGFGVALLFDRDPWGVGILQTLFILPMVTPPAIAGRMFQLLEHSEFGVISWALYGLNILSREEPLLGGTGKYALIGVLIADVWQWTPFFALILLAGLKALPHEPMEAAQVDGATPLQRFWHVVLPLMRGVIAVAVLFRLIDLYKTFDYVFILTSGGPGEATTTLSYYMYRYYESIRWGYMSALGVFILLIVWVSAFVYTKLFRVQW